MRVLDLYSHRKRVANGNAPDAFTYDELPSELRVQVAHIWSDAIGNDNAVAWKGIHNVVAREHGLFALADRRGFVDRCRRYLLDHPSVDEVLDLIEVSFRYIDGATRKMDAFKRRELGIEVSADDAVGELNERFRRAGVGYQFESRMIIRVDSELIHREVVRPALRYLHHPGFEGPRDEFLRAHACYRAGDTKEAVTNANNAFESTLKAICDQRGWKFDSGVTGPRLVKLVRANGLLPDYLENPFEQLVGVLKSGLSGVRNNVASHGQGSTPRETPEYVAAFALHLAAAKILFLVEAHTATT